MEVHTPNLVIKPNLVNTLSNNQQPFTTALNIHLYMSIHDFLMNVA